MVVENSIEEEKILEVILVVNLSGVEFKISREFEKEGIELKDKKFLFFKDKLILLIDCYDGKELFLGIIDVLKERLIFGKKILKFDKVFSLI